MGVVQLPDDIKAIIDTQVSAGRVASEAASLEQAVRRLAAELGAEDEVVAAAEAGIKDIEAGRYQLISNAEDLQRLRAELSEDLDILDAGNALEPL